MGPPPHPFSADLSLKWDWDGAKIFDVDTSSTQNKTFPLLLQFWLGRTLNPALFHAWHLLPPTATQYEHSYVVLVPASLTV